MNVVLAMTAVAHGATVANHIEVTGLIKEKDDQGRLVVRGAHVRDTLTGETWTVHAKVSK
jgi:glycerol-3-phosphate dehydrogenase